MLCGMFCRNREKGFLKEALGKATAEAQAKTAETDRQRGEVTFDFRQTFFTLTSGVRQYYGFGFMRHLSFLSYTLLRYAKYSKYLAGHIWSGEFGCHR